MTLLIDNYDSFSYNLYQLLGGLGETVKVVRNDAVTIEDIAAMAPGHIVLSPGPGRPEDAGICPDVIRAFAGKIPILGVCLGHQAIGMVYGARVTYAKEVMHGKKSDVSVIAPSPLFEGVSNPFQAARYHSLAVDRGTLPEELIVTAETADGEIMALQHRDYPLYGVQFHPESILTPEGAKMAANFLRTSV